MCITYNTHWMFPVICRNFCCFYPSHNSSTWYRMCLMLIYKKSHSPGDKCSINKPIIYYCACGPVPGSRSVGELFKNSSPMILSSTLSVLVYVSGFQYVLR